MFKISQDLLKLAHYLVRNSVKKASVEPGRWVNAIIDEGQKKDRHPQEILDRVQEFTERWHWHYNRKVNDMGESEAEQEALDEATKVLDESDDINDRIKESSLRKKAGLKPVQWAARLIEMGKAIDDDPSTILEVVDGFVSRWYGALEYAKEEGMDDKEEYAARTAIDELPERYLEDTTKYHEEGRGPID